MDVVRHWNEEGSGNTESARGTRGEPPVVYIPLLPCPDEESDNRCGNETYTAHPQTLAPFHPATNLLHEQAPIIYTAASCILLKKGKLDYYMGRRKVRVAR